MWHKEKHKFINCSCGMLVKQAYLGKHRQGIWHYQHAELLALRQRGLSFAAIGRQVGRSRACVRQTFAKAGIS